MARSSSQPVLEHLRDSQSHSEQLAALQVLKNDIVGHQQKKAQWVRRGVVEPLMRFLTPAGYDQRQTYNGKSSASTMTEEQQVRWQALCVMGSLAYGELFW